jgi:hypothetical protein
MKFRKNSFPKRLSEPWSSKFCMDNGASLTVGGETPTGDETKATRPNPLASALVKNLQEIRVLDAQVDLVEQCPRVLLRYEQDSIEQLQFHDHARETATQT